MLDIKTSTHYPAAMPIYKPSISICSQARQHAITKKFLQEGAYVVTDKAKIEVLEADKLT
jgi:hypothetical protein